jgi:hypothetical protein
MNSLRDLTTASNPNMNADQLQCYAGTAQCEKRKTGKVSNEDILFLP